MGDCMDALNEDAPALALGFERKVGKYVKVNYRVCYLLALVFDAAERVEEGLRSGRLGWPELSEVKGEAEGVLEGFRRKMGGREEVCTILDMISGGEGCRYVWLTLWC